MSEDVSSSLGASSAPSSWSQPRVPAGPAVSLFGARRMLNALLRQIGNAGMADRPWTEDALRRVLATRNLNLSADELQTVIAAAQPRSPASSGNEPVRVPVPRAGRPLQLPVPRTLSCSMPTVPVPLPRRRSTAIGQPLLEALNRHVLPSDRSLLSRPQLMDLLRTELDDPSENTLTRAIDRLLELGVLSTPCRGRYARTGNALPVARLLEMGRDRRVVGTRRRARSHGSR
ncbi:hypothetical protein GT347_18855 [Xylophilus rhododendri]|uniref:Uncharacterized protein n=1 Tax=Xylophilus rhododendri TaxID=2697032 RepID=A0A857JAU5_9BURK|nr:hypothetical protein [Xylophilus rhododendri]QHI99858.1 hypothetical protein GT347_18855 [Xylophilus rhododendri]